MTKAIAIARAAAQGPLSVLALLQANPKTAFRRASKRRGGAGHPQMLPVRRIAMFAGFIGLLFTALFLLFRSN